jgi:hypothetical protein
MYYPTHQKGKERTATEQRGYKRERKANRALSLSIYILQRVGVRKTKER